MEDVIVIKGEVHVSKCVVVLFNDSHVWDVYITCLYTMINSWFVNINGYVNEKVFNFFHVLSKEWLRKEVMIFEVVFPESIDSLFIFGSLDVLHDTKFIVHKVQESEVIVSFTSYRWFLNRIFFLCILKI